MDSVLAAIQPSAHPNPIPSSHHRKIELQSYADLTYLQLNLAKAARDKLDLHFPPITNSSKPAAPATVISLDGGVLASEQETQPTEGREIDKQQQQEEEDEDPLRTRVRQLIDTFLLATAQSASHSISVNGIDASSLPPNQIPSCTNPNPQGNKENAHMNDSDENSANHEIEGIHYAYEAFDPRLQKKLAALHGELETLTAQVSKLRRDAPRQAASVFASELEDRMRQDDEEWNVQQQRQKKALNDEEGLNVQVLRDGWNRDVKETYERGIAQLAVLSGVGATQDRNQRDVSYQEGDMGVSLTETVGRAQRARTVAMEFE